MMGCEAAHAHRLRIAARESFMALGDARFGMVIAGEKNKSKRYDM